MEIISCHLPFLILLFVFYWITDNLDILMEVKIMEEIWKEIPHYEGRYLVSN